MHYVEESERKTDRMRNNFELRLKGFRERKRKEYDVDVSLEALGMTSKRSRGIKARHDGQRCFIIASGPSLKEQDVNWLRNEITIGVNGVPKYLNETYGWTPTFNVITDANRQWCPKLLDIARGFPSTQLVVSSYVSKRFKEELPDNLVLTVQYPASAVRSLQGGHINHFLDERIHLAGSGGYVVSDTAIQLAMYLGCNPIYIVGQDHNTEQSVAPLKEGARTHGEEAIDTSTCAFVLLNAYAKQCGFQLFNATKAKNLTVLPFADLNALKLDTPPLPTLDRIENIHRGQRCFLIRSGLSTNRLMLGALAKEITISVDDGYIDAASWDFGPTYGCVSGSAHQAVYKDLQQLETRIVAPRTRLQSEGFYGLPAGELQPLGKGTAMSAAIPLAFHMGCDPIYLAGFDTGTMARSYDPESEISPAFTSEEMSDLRAGLKNVHEEADKLRRRVLLVSGQDVEGITKIPFTHLFRVGPVDWDV